MVERDRSVYVWDEREEEGLWVGGLQSSISSSDAELSTKRIRVEEESPDSIQQLQGGKEKEEGERRPLGLRLRKTPSFLKLLESSLSKARDQSEKLKASNFPANSIKIGSWQRMSRHEGDLTAKLYYAKRKLVWEVLDGALKSKIEIQWSDISAIRAIIPQGILDIELSQPPSFFREITPQPRKHTIWQAASDFTGGQAPIWRRHQVIFQGGVLDKHYERLLQCDPRLLELSQKPFPSQQSPYFDPTLFGISPFSLMSFNTTASSSAYFPTAPLPYPSYHTTNPSVMMNSLSWPPQNYYQNHDMVTHSSHEQPTLPNLESTNMIMTNNIHGYEYGDKDHLYSHQNVDWDMLPPQPNNNVGMQSSLLPPFPYNDDVNYPSNPTTGFSYNLHYPSNS